MERREGRKALRRRALEEAWEILDRTNGGNKGYLARNIDQQTITMKVPVLKGDGAVEYVHITESADDFPSDALMAQLQLLLG